MWNCEMKYIKIIYYLWYMYNKMFYLGMIFYDLKLGIFKREDDYGKNEFIIEGEES